MLAEWLAAIVVSPSSLRAPPSAGNDSQQGSREPIGQRVRPDGSQRVFTLLHDARPVLPNLGEPGGITAASSGKRSPRDRSLDSQSTSRRLPRQSY